MVSAAAAAPGAVVVTVEGGGTGATAARDGGGEVDGFSSLSLDLTTGYFVDVGLPGPSGSRIEVREEEDAVGIPVMPGGFGLTGGLTLDERGGKVGA